MQIFERGNDIRGLMPPKPMKLVGGKRTWKWLIHLFDKHLLRNFSVTDNISKQNRQKFLLSWSLDSSMGDSQ